MSHPSSPIRTAVLNVVGLTSRHLGESTPFLSSFARREGNRVARVTPVLPAVTSTVQATYLTGKPPSGHGIVGNYWYDRDYGEHRAWKQSNRLVQGRKLWEELRERLPGFTCAKLFWWNNMYSTADYQVTPRPIYRVDGKKIFDVQTWPLDLGPKVQADLGAFPFPAFWGPGAGIASSRWIADCARWFEEQFQPHLHLVYLPHLDYNLQRLHPDGPGIEPDLRDIDEVVERLVTFYESRGVQVILLSEYGITPVSRAIHLNRVFREHGWIVCRDELGHEQIDPGNCRALAIADHQVAHVYVNDPSIREAVRRAIAETPGVESVFDPAQCPERMLAHERSGDFVAVAEPDAWFTYYYWNDDERAPDFARCVDIHRKPGYDPVELFLDPALRFPRLAVATRLAKKILGLRMKMDVIPLDASLVRGSHGRIPEDPDDLPLLLGPLPTVAGDSTIEATEVYGHLLHACAAEASS